jgi:hypothetical protein
LHKLKDCPLVRAGSNRYAAMPSLLKAPHVHPALKQHCSSYRVTGEER